MKVEHPIRILFMRHGQSEGNVDSRKYIEKGDSKIGLTEPGWWQAYGTGKFLKDFYAENGVANWPVIFHSPYQRTRETLAGVVHGLNGHFHGPPKTYEDWRLAEKFFGGASYLEQPDEDMDPTTIATLKALSERVYKNDPLSAANIFGEATKSVRINIKDFSDGTLRRDIDEGKKEFLFVVHGAVIQAFIMNWMYIRPEDKKKIGRLGGFEGNPNNGDVIELSGTTKNWKVRKLWDGEKGERMNVDILDGIKPFSAEDLPPVPDFLKNRP